jgi:O-antigen/teichoic acid export membrane protein
MILVSLLGYVGLFFIYRYGLDYEYGMVAFGLAYVGLFSFLTRLGLSRAHIRHIAEGKDLGKCIGTYIVIKVALICLMSIVTISSVLIWKFVFGRGFESPQHEIVIYLMIVFYVVLELANIANHTYQARRESAKEKIPTIIDPIIRVPLIIIVAVFSLGIFALVGAYILGMVAFLIVSFVLFRRYPIKRFDKSLFKSYYQFALPLIVSGALGAVMRNIDKIMIQLFWNSVHVGYYFGVERIVASILIVSIAVTALLFPEMTKYHAKNNLAKIRELSRASFRYVSMIIMPCVVVLFVCSKPILYLLNERVADNASVLLQIMALYALFITFTRLSFNEIMAVNRPGIVAKIGITMSLINIFLNLILIPTSLFGFKLFGFGAVGAAFATLSTAIISFILYSIYSHKLTGIKPPKNIILHILSGCLMGLILFGLTYSINIVHWYEVAGAGLFGIGIYFGILFIIREFTKEDFYTILHAINPIKMKDYVKNELKEKYR